MEMLRTKLSDSKRTTKDYLGRTAQKVIEIYLVSNKMMIKESTRASQQKYILVLVRILIWKEQKNEQIEENVN